MNLSTPQAHSLRLFPEVCHACSYWCRLCTCWLVRSAGEHTHRQVHRNTPPHTNRPTWKHTCMQTHKRGFCQISWLFLVNTRIMNVLSKAHCLQALFIRVIVCVLKVCMWVLCQAEPKQAQTVPMWTPPSPPKPTCRRQNESRMCNSRATRME